ncbi:MAG: aminotransferase class V-fold PLP-dependent enzyme [Myxococcota bacterium]
MNIIKHGDKDGVWLLDAFVRDMAKRGVDGVRQGLIGRDRVFETPFGEKRLLYADYVASGRALDPVEDFIRRDVLPFYANTHTEASYCGRATSRLREAVRARIAELVGAEGDCHVVFSGAGATSGINRLVAMLDVERAKHAVVFIGPYEHHSNVLPWRESGADVREVRARPDGHLDLEDLARSLRRLGGADLVVGSFSAASNVTGIITDTDRVSQILRAHGAFAVWDYAGGGPYLPINMSSGDTSKDAVVFSPHKFPGGPGASGILVVRDRVIRHQKPDITGGGTVSFVSPWQHRYLDRLEARYEAGTPNIIGDIRAGLAMLVKHAIGLDTIAERDAQLRGRALRAFTDPRLEVLERGATPALPIFSFRVRNDEGELLHHQLVTRILSDFYGIQARGGCACAGPYAHALLRIDRTASEALLQQLQAGQELTKPGWVRFNLSYLHDEAEIAAILDAIAELPDRVGELAPLYQADPKTARFAWSGHPAAASSVA